MVFMDFPPQRLDFWPPERKVVSAGTFVKLARGRHHAKCGELGHNSSTATLEERLEGLY
jgi:hypothetical protein